MNTLKKFISYYRPYRAVFYFDLFCAAVISVVDLAYPQLLRSLTKTLFTGNKSAILGALPWLFLILLMMYTVQSLCKYYVTCQGHIMGAKMERDMRKQLFEHYEKLSFSYYSTHNSGQMMSKLVSDLFDISELAHHGPENLFISLVKIIGSFVFLFLINQKLALPLLLLVILMILFSIRQNKKMQQTFLENRIRIGDINASLQDTLSGIRVVQSFANEDTELHKFNHSNEAFLESKKDNYRCMGTFMSSNLFFQGMMYLTTLIYGGYLIAMGQMQAADLAMYALYIGIFISPIQILVELVEMLQKGLSGFRRYLEVVETEPEIQDKEGAIDLENVKGDVCYDNVSFHYSDDNKTVLSQVSIHIPAGKSVALVGPSGGGKTTICSLLPRFYDVTAGKVTIDGKDVRDLTLKSLRNQIGMVQQDVYLFDGTIRENIAYGKPDPTDKEIKEAAKTIDAGESNPLTEEILSLIPENKEPLDTPTQVTSEQIKELTPTMTREDVLSLLGDTQDVGSGIYIYLYEVDQQYLLRIPFASDEAQLGVTGEDLLKALVPISGDIAPMVYVNDTLYQIVDSQPNFADEKSSFNLLGKIENTVSSSEEPKENFQANDDIVGAAVYQYGDNIVVEFEGKYWLYEHYHNTDFDGNSD